MRSHTPCISMVSVLLFSTCSCFCHPFHVCSPEIELDTNVGLPCITFPSACLRRAHLCEPCRTNLQICSVLFPSPLRISHPLIAGCLKPFPVRVQEVMLLFLPHRHHRHRGRLPRQRLRSIVSTPSNLSLSWVRVWAPMSGRATCPSRFFIAN